VSAAAVVAGPAPAFFSRNPVIARWAREDAQVAEPGAPGSGRGSGSGSRGVGGLAGAATPGRRQAPRRDDYADLEDFIADDDDET
jgi:hypothetical protein